MALPSAFWFSLAGLVLLAPQPSSADTFFVFAGGYALDTSHHCASVGSDTSATCDATNTSTDASTGETKSGTIDVAADLTSGNLMVHAESMASLPTAQAGGEAQIGDTLTFGGAISHGSTTTVTMTGTMSDSNSGGGSNSFTGGALEIFDDTGLLTSGGACSRPTSGFICDPTNDQTQVSVIGDSFSAATELHKGSGFALRWCGALHYLCSQKSAQDAKTFFSAVSSGIGINSKTSPAYAIRDRLLKNAMEGPSGNKQGDTYMAACFAKAWNAYRDARPMRKVYWRHPTQNPNESFPRVK